MDPYAIQRLLRQVSRTAGEEISCSECFELLAPCVELELAGGPPAAAMPALAQHLGQCGVCREEYETLRDFMRQQGDGPPLPSEDPSSPAR